MSSIQDRMKQALLERQRDGLKRQLPVSMKDQVDFCSNDYLGFARDLPYPAGYSAGGTGSRLISGNSDLAEEVETIVAKYHGAEAALLFPSGYSANIGLLPAVVSRKDTIVFDKLLHASLRDGIRLTQARALGFVHNDVKDLDAKLSRAEGAKWVIVESVYSMDGDEAPLEAIVAVCKLHKAYLIVDEAHGTGVLGACGEGGVCALGLEEEVWARVHTFGKAVGSHGAAVLGSALLKEYLINFSRSFIYTTALPPATLAHVKEAYEVMGRKGAIEKLYAVVQYFLEQCPDTIKARLISSRTPIQAVLCPGNSEVNALAAHLQSKKMAVLPIRYPTVPLGEERIRVCLHAFNSNEQIDELLATLDEYFRTVG